MSDGISDGVSTEEMTNILKTKKVAVSVAFKLVKLAFNNMSSDNLSIIAVRI